MAKLLTLHVDAAARCPWVPAGAGGAGLLLAPGPSSSVAAPGPLTCHLNQHNQLEVLEKSEMVYGLSSRRWQVGPPPGDPRNHVFPCCFQLVKAKESRDSRGWKE